MTLIERMARAIGGYYDGDADPVDSPNNYRAAKGAVLEALKAMRDPTEKMTMAGLWSDADFKDGLTGRSAAIASWQAMIDAALEEAAKAE